jgi:hypothetical protein
MIIKFYTVPLQKCDCGKAAAFLVMGTGNVEYAKCCEECAPKKVESLTYFWSGQDEETKKHQLEVTRQKA